MKKIVLAAAAGLLFAALSLFAQGEQAFQGQITQCKCSGSGSRAAAPGSGETTSPCAAACSEKGVTYVLYDARNKIAYQVDKQKKCKAFVGQYVLIIGSLDQATATIEVDDISRALPPKVMQAKSVYIYCDGCVRAMAKAKSAAFEQLTVWNRLTVVPNPRKADLIFLFSANPYLGDYVTRDGPDKRPVAIEITYMNVVDPQTGEDLWGDFRDWGSLRVAGATRDLVAEFGRQFEEQQNLAARQ
jgi:hypothetical protein